MTNQEAQINQLKLFRSAFEALGYTPIKNIKAYSKGDSWYSHRLNSSAVSHFAYLDYKPKGKAYGISVGFANTQVQQILKRNIHIIEKYIFPAAIGTSFLTKPRLF
jgi:hypothetical protein